MIALLKTANRRVMIPRYDVLSAGKGEPCPGLGWDAATGGKVAVCENRKGLLSPVKQFWRKKYFSNPH